MKITKAHRLYHKLQELIDKSSQNAQLPTERDLAQTHQLSRETVRRIYEKLIQEGKVTRQQGRGYFISNPKRIYTILIVGPNPIEKHRLATYFTPYFMGLIQAFSEMDQTLLPVICSVHLFLSEVPTLEQHYPNLSAIIIFNLGYLFEEKKELMKLLKVPTLFVGTDHIKLETSVSSIVFKEREIAEKAIEYFKKMGCQELLLWGPMTYYAHLWRESVFKKSCLEKKVTLLDLEDKYLSKNEDTIFKINKDHPILSWFKKRKRKIGIFCTTDSAAIRLSNAIDRMNLPIEVFLLGVEGDPISELSNPQVSQISLDFRQMAAQSVNLLLDQIGNGKVRHETVAVFLSERNSV